MSGGVAGERRDHPAVPYADLDPRGGAVVDAAAAGAMLASSSTTRRVAPAPLRTSTKEREARCNGISRPLRDIAQCLTSVR